MKTYTVRITKQARRHLTDIKRYIAEELLAPKAAYSTLVAIESKIRSLSNMPSRVKLTEEEPWHSQGIRRMHVKSYYLYFWIDEERNKVQIIAVIYEGRDQVAQLELLSKKGVTGWTEI